ncbi:MAG TPA: hypothetical protein VMV09_08205 [Candidatus Saccharimonadales bacterium]|nr:hypothetical protein [Candidatus Saccharimonadales bacterium]
MTSGDPSWHGLSSCGLPGGAFEDADASLELLVTPGTPGDEPPFALPESLAVARETSTPRAAEPSRNVQASVTVMVAGAVDHTAAEAAGPVEALDTAPRRALAPHLPTLGLLQLVYSYEWAARHAASLACLFPTA